MDNHEFELVVGVILLIMGIVGIVRKRFSFGLRRSGLVYVNLVITLTAARAVFFSLICIGEGGIIVALWFLAATGDKILNEGWLTIAAGAGLMITPLVFLICAFFELLEHIRTQAENSKTENRPK